MGHLRGSLVADLAAAYARDLTNPSAETGSESAPEPPWLETRFLQGMR